MKSPQISVLLPVYNEEYYLTHCLDSILAQTGAAFEICISDNASTDRTWEIISSYRDNYEAVKAYRQPSPVHPFENFAQTIRIAKGDFVYLIGGDDYLLPGFFAEAISQFKANPHLVGYLTSRKSFRDGTNEIMGIGPPPNFEAELNEPNDRLIRFVLNHISHDEIFIGMFERAQYTRATGLINRDSVETPAIWAFLAIALAAKNYRNRIRISKTVHLMKRYFKCHGQNSNYKRSASGSKNMYAYRIEQVFGSIQNIFRFKFHGLISWNEAFLLLFASVCSFDMF